MFTNEFTKAVADQVSNNILAELGKHVPQKIAPRYLTLESAAQYMDRTKRAVESYIAEGIFPVIRKGGKIWLDKEDIDRTMSKWKR